MGNKKWYKVYGVGADGIEYLLGTIQSLSNANIFANAMSKSYKRIRVV